MWNSKAIIGENSTRDPRTVFIGTFGVSIASYSSEAYFGGGGGGGGLTKYL